MFTFALPIAIAAGRVGTLAQLVEQRTENPCVTGSIPVGTTRREETESSVFFPPFFLPKPLSVAQIRATTLFNFGV